MTAPISPDALEAAHWLIAGTTGSGKTYLARGLFEQLRRAGRRVGAIDKIQKLWGLTISADGTGPGLEFVIFGGKRPGAVPMRPSDGDRLGRLFVERNVPAIFDLYGWDADEQDEWVAAFSRAVLMRNEAALHLLMDEAQSWVPANGGGEAYKAVRMLAEQGRGNGINLLLTAPRLNGVDVAVRQAVGGMVAMRQTSGRDQAAVAELIGGHVEVDERALRAELASLATGTGFVWSPNSRIVEKVAFPTNTTFDSSRAPKHGDAPPPPIAVSSALVEELRAALAPPSADAERAEALRVVDEAGGALADVLADRDRRIAELEAEAEQLRRELVEAERMRQLAVATGKRATDALSSVARHATEQLDGVAQNGWRSMIESDAAARADRTPAESAGVAEEAVGKHASSASLSQAASAPLPAGGEGAAGGARRGASPAANEALAALPPMTMRLLQQLVRIYPRSLPIAQLAEVARVGIKSSQWSRHFRAFRDSGLAQLLATNREWQLSDAGVEAFGATMRPQAGAELLAFWIDRLPPATGRMLRVLVQARGPQKRDAIADRAGLSRTSSTVGAGLGELKAHGLALPAGPGAWQAADFLL